MPVFGSRQTGAGETASQRPAPRIVLAIGLPGSGKSTWFRRRGLVPLSSDLLRQLLYDNAADQRDPDRVFRLLRRLLAERLELGRPVSYVDATNLTRRERAPFFRLARQYGAKVEALFFDTPLEQCLQRNEQRRRRVPEGAVRRMAARLEPPTFAEGFSRIVRVRPRVAPRRESSMIGATGERSDGSEHDAERGTAGENSGAGSAARLLRRSGAGGGHC
jgi:predicted kinase